MWAVSREDYGVLDEESLCNSLEVKVWGEKVVPRLF
jgi:hypothetical protein